MKSVSFLNMCNAGQDLKNMNMLSRNSDKGKVGWINGQ